jgi:hypothetical protein
MNDKIKAARLLAIIATLLLVAAVFGRWPYTFYTLLRLFVCGIAVYLAFAAYTANNKLWPWLMGGLVILFNPLVPIHLNRSSWQVLDALATIALLIFIASYKSIQCPSGT